MEIELYLVKIAKNSRRQRWAPADRPMTAKAWNRQFYNIKFQMTTKKTEKLEKCIIYKVDTTGTIPNHSICGLIVHLLLILGIE
jgi:hypothetical protein